VSGEWFWFGESRKAVQVHFEKWLILVPLYSVLSVLSVYSVVLACKNNHGLDDGRTFRLSANEVALDLIYVDIDFF
jgi:hypothetical protein